VPNPEKKIRETGVRLESSAVLCTDRVAMRIRQTQIHKIADKSCNNFPQQIKKGQKEVTCFQDVIKFIMIRTLLGWVYRPVERGKGKSFLWARDVWEPRRRSKI